MNEFNHRVYSWHKVLHRYLRVSRTLYVPPTDVEMLVKIVTQTDDRVIRHVETWHRSHLLLIPVSESGTAQNSDPYLLHSLYTCCGDGSERLLL